ncbi:HAD family hydrolase [Rhodobium gokarnense]|uniref:HAD superfamily hydrolase (TIGR01509 family) n=1 Tax=Rhodobium gokarnense TaxID=364296 RepID=A0ABT3H880_9HYPH|nr:HAD family hydrolase [Rhodobium gokarnense]MCW2306590.1 HAD superfamily hydrolase (TIGR01509 family) [Rhodobium gokarnense]
MAEMQALIFDCDGVLVDTERDGHRVAFNKAFAAKGLDVTWSVERYGELLKTAGGKERMRRHFDETEWPVPEEERDAFILDLHKLKTGLFMELIEGGALPLRPGIAAIVDEAIADGKKIAVCSTSNERAVQAVVDVLLGPDRAKHMPVFAGDMVPRKKPNPDIYNLAKDKLGLDPAACVVVEDSEIGMKAALAAGMHCVVTTSSYTADEDFSGADKVVPSLAEVTLTDCKTLT